MSEYNDASSASQKENESAIPSLAYLRLKFPVVFFFLLSINKAFGLQDGGYTQYISCGHSLNLLCWLAVLSTQLWQSFTICSWSILGQMVEVMAAPSNIQW